MTKLKQMTESSYGCAGGSGFESFLFHICDIYLHFMFRLKDTIKKVSEEKPKVNRDEETKACNKIN